MSDPLDDHRRALTAIAALRRSLAIAQDEARSELYAAIRAAHAAGMFRHEIAALAEVDYSRPITEALKG